MIPVSGTDWQAIPGASLCGTLREIQSGVPPLLDGIRGALRSWSPLRGSMRRAPTDRKSDAWRE